MKKNIIYIFYCIVMIVLGLYSVLALNSHHIITSLAVVLILGLFSFLLLKKDTIKVHNKFLLLVIPIGLLYLISFPIGTIPDEANHFYRTYEISEGHIISKWNKNYKSGGNNLPNNITTVTAEKYSEIKDDLTIKSANKNQFIGFSNTALYSPICYIPQVVGMLFSKIFTNNFTIMAYAGRLCNFIFFLIIMFFSIKILPIKKNLLLFITLLPITIQEAVSLSPDALTIASCSLLISFIFYLREKQGLLNKKEKLLLIILPIVIALCKIVYLPICLLLFLIPKDKFDSLKKKNIFIIILALFVVMINLLWTSRVSVFLTSNLHGSNSSKQIMYVLKYPQIYIKTLLNTFNVYADFHIFNMLGRYLSLFNVNVYAPYIYINLIVLILLLAQNEKEKTKNNIVFNKSLLFFVFIATMLLIFTSIYIQWTPYMLNYVDGVQGRYYLPIILVLGLAVNNIFKIDIKENLMNKYILLFMIVENISAVLTIISVYM